MVQFHLFPMLQSKKEKIFSGIYFNNITYIYMVKVFVNMEHEEYKEKSWNLNQAEK